MTFFKYTASLEGEVCIYDISQYCMIKQRVTGDSYPTTGLTSKYKFVFVSE